MASRINKGAVLALALGIGGAVAVGGALAHNEPMPKGPMSAAAKAAHQRHENFEKLGKTFKTLNDELRKGAPDKAVLTSSTQAMHELAGALPTWFPRGSGVEARPKSEAKPNIWSDAAGFTAAASALQAQVSKLHETALSGDVNAVRTQVRATGGACKGCHDKYRQEKS